MTGIVQGVGFRPFVYRLAQELGLDGSVGNDSSRVVIEAVGSPAALDELERRLVDDAPPLAHVERVVRTAWAIDRRPIGRGFRIAASERLRGARTLVPPDTAVCDDCLAELFDPEDRRFAHPFITCTNCGPRFTIIRDLPYDRHATTMAGFPMCPACAAEYANPADRRHHAQPIACHDCGPTLVFRSGNGDPPSEREAAMARAREALGAGLTVAVKGLGGYHLACDATSTDAVTRLRHRKQRPDKPFAVLVRDLAAACELAVVGPAEAAELVSPARPVVLLRARGDTRLCALVAPGNPLVGLMLPHTPIQHLLMAGGMPPLVMTSGNRSGEPIAYRDDDAASRLGGLSDAVLGHDRPIHVPCDDSVVRVVGNALLPLRRGRGFAPVPIPWTGGKRSVLAVGGQLKTTICVSSRDHAWVSQHIGDMENLATLEAFQNTVEQLQSLCAIEPDVVAVDPHPGYATAQWARRHHPDRIVEVQHHHAHVAAVMAEHDLDPSEPVVGFAFDGTGYGADGTIWGGEVLIADAATAQRAWHLAEVPLPGGDAAIHNPYRVALAHLAAAGIGWNGDLPPVQQLDGVEGELLERQLATGFNCVPTSSMGRLFDAVASLIGLRHRISFEAQAAIDLEVAAERSPRVDDGTRFTVDAGRIDWAPVLRAIVSARRAGTAGPDLAYSFHLAVAELVVELAAEARADRGIEHVVLAGGVFQNALLMSMCVDRLSQVGLVPLTHRLVPPNDGGLALGQAYVAAHRPIADPSIDPVDRGATDPIPAERPI
ncbi:MAG: carbamoyltransferase HypF [Acidimicrobiales bacterium]